MTRVGTTRRALPHRTLDFTQTQLTASRSVHSECPHIYFIGM